MTVCDETDCKTSNYDWSAMYDIVSMPTQYHGVYGCQLSWWAYIFLMCLLNVTIAISGLVV